MTKNVLAFFHGNVTGFEPLSRHAANEQLWRSLVAVRPALEARIDKRIDVEWGYPLGATQERPDERLSAAERFVWSVIDPSARQPKSRFDVSALDLRLPVQWFTRAFSRLNTFSLSDSTYYAAGDGEAAVRYTVYQQVLEALEPWKSEEVRLHVIAESLGTVVAHDFLFGLFDPAPPGYRPRFLTDPRPIPPGAEGVPALFDGWRARARGSLQLGSVTMFASQIPHFVMRRQILIDQLAGGTLLDPAVIGVEGKEVRWQLFRDRCDLLAYPTRRLYAPSEAIREFEVRATSWLRGRLHGGYERNRTVLRETADLLYRTSHP